MDLVLWEIVFFIRLDSKNYPIVIYNKIIIQLIIIIIRPDKFDLLRELNTLFACFG